MIRSTVSLFASTLALGACTTAVVAETKPQPVPLDPVVVLEADETIGGPDYQLEAISPTAGAVQVGLAGSDPANIARYLLARGASGARLSPGGEHVAFRYSVTGVPQLWVARATGGAPQQLTSDPTIETAPSFSPDGSQIVFESDRSGTQQLYVMDANGGEATRISFGQGRYGTPVWSPRGDLVAFTKQNRGRFHIGVMRTDGSGERLLTASFLDEGPTWAPNGRVIMFTRETAGSAGSSTLYSVDISGRNLKAVQTNASDPSWSPLLK